MRISQHPGTMAADFVGGVARVALIGRLGRWEFGTFSKIIRALNPEIETVFVLIHSSASDNPGLSLEIACDAIFYSRAKVIAYVQDAIGPAFELARHCRHVLATPMARLGVDGTNCCHAELAEARGIVSLIVPDLETVERIFQRISQEK